MWVVGGGGGGGGSVTTSFLWHLLGFISNCFFIRIIIIT